MHCEKFQTQVERKTAPVAGSVKTLLNDTLLTGERQQERSFKVALPPERAQMQRLCLPLGVPLHKATR